MLGQIQVQYRFQAICSRALVKAQQGKQQKHRSKQRYVEGFKALFTQHIPALKIPEQHIYIETAFILIIDLNV